MKIFVRARRVVSVVVVAALVGGCGGGQPPLASPSTFRAAVPMLEVCTCEGSPQNLLAMFAGRSHESPSRPRTTSTSHTIWNFGQGEDGRYPQAPLIAAGNGSFFGTTATGGQFDGGTVFKLTRSRSGYQEKVIWSFGASQSDGRSPNDGLIEDSSGALYGTTYAGGDGACYNGCGTVFKLTPSGGAYTEQILHAFSGASDGVSPYGSVLEDSTGALYSTTIFGGVNGAGTVFKLTPSGSTYAEQIIWSFGGKSDGTCPYTQLIAGKRGVLYGTTLTGGLRNDGTVFEIKPSKSGYTEDVLWNFGGPGDGACVYAPLIRQRNYLYGLTYSLGAYLVGTAFQITLQGPHPTERVIWSFGHGQDGSYPANGGLTADSAGTLYGSTLFGGSGNYGSIFALTPTGAKFSERVVLSFNHGDGSNPDAAPLLKRSGVLYGTTLTGGAYNEGTVYELQP
ncbi:MAG: choice-of-anchor tandem repeat GloVer-containing protein [Candidatus Cybelea sp.]|jgi:uncharacterized repeat protein (TIGR03803 family)